MMMSRCCWPLNITIVFFAFLAWLPSGSSQDFAYDYRPIREYSPDSIMMSGFQKGFKAWPDKTSFTNEKIKAKFAEYAEQKARFVHVLDSMDLLMYTDSISIFLNDVKDQIQQHNPDLQKRTFHVFAFRSAEPNAYSIGEGIIFINLGLLERLHSREQLAFVIAHELGHDMLNHSINDTKRLSESYFSDDFKKLVRKTGRKRIERNSALHKMINGFFANHMRYSRKNEIIADSIGFRYFTNSGFAPEAAMQTLEILDNADELLYKDSLKLSDYLSFEQYPFKSYWLSTENTNQAWVADSTLFIVPDSMKSHPDCMERMKLIEDEISRENKDVTLPISDSVQIKKLLPKISFEILESLMQSQDYTLALYISLHMQKQYPENKYLKSVVANCLFELAEALSRNEYLDYVDFPDKDYSPAFNKLLVFLHNMSSSTLRKLFNNYLNTNLAAETENAYVAYLKLISDTQSPLTSERIDDFDIRFHDPYFQKLLNEKLDKLTTLKK